MLRQLMLAKKLEGLRAALAALAETETGFTARREELTAAIEEASTDEELAVVQENVEKLEGEESELAEKKSKLQEEINKLEGELEELKSKEPGGPAKVPQSRQREDESILNKRDKFGMTMEQRAAFVAREEVKNFLDNIRSIKTRGVVNGSLTVPDVMLSLLRDNMEQYSKLVKYVNLKPVGGTARQNIMGVAPEGVWMEAEGELNELDMSLNQVETDGYMVGGVIWVHNNLLKDSGINLAGEIMEQLGKAIGKGVDRGILYGTGVKMPLGIVTRLAQTSAPNDWGTYAPAWTDLHTSNVLKLNIDGTTGAAFYASLIAALGVAKPNHSDGKVFWVMNRKTHIKLMTKALAFDAAAALLAGVNNQMPIVGGNIEELEVVGDNEIIGGFGSVYLLAEREGAVIESSEHVRFTQNQTGFKGYARYDGMPVFGEAFVMVNFANADATTTSTFPIDYANTELGVLGVTAAASLTATGKTVLTVTGTEASGTTLQYKIGDLTVKTGQKVSGYTDLTSGTTEITAAAGKVITVVELDAASRVIKAGKVVSVPKTA